jgi:hypothetical protein
MCGRGTYARKSRGGRSMPAVRKLVAASEAGCPGRRMAISRPGKIEEGVGATAPTQHGVDTQHWLPAWR